jgi:hypothetical protein
MTIAVGLFDLFTYSIPGALNLAFIGYLLTRADVFDPGDLNRIPAVLLVIAVVIVSYVLGNVTYRLSTLLGRLIPFARRSASDARREFVGRNPVARERAFVQSDQHLLLAAVELHNAEVATEISRLRAVGLMMHSCAIPSLFAFLAAAVELFAGAPPLVAGCCGAVFLLVLLGALYQGSILRYWATLKTFEVCFWIPDIDERLES